MSVFDISLLVIIAGFALAGLWFGIIHTVGSLVGTIAGVYLASRYYEPMAAWLIKTTGWGENTTKVVMFVIAFFIINRLVGFLFFLLDRVLSLITRLPFINSINRLLGFLLGLVEGVFTIGLVVYFIERFPLSDKIMSLIAVSKIAPYTSKIANIFIPLMPDALKMLKSSVDYVQGKIL